MAQESKSNDANNVKYVTTGALKTKPMPREMANNFEPINDDIVMKGKDDRQRALPADYIMRDPPHYFNINKDDITKRTGFTQNALESFLMIKTAYKNGKGGCGSATIINPPRYQMRHSNRMYLLTAARCVVQFGPNGKDIKPVYPEYMWCERRKNTNNGSELAKTYKIDKYYIHPKFFENPTSCSGHDIAIVSCIDVDGYLNKITGFFMTYGASNCSTYCKVIGYPGGNKKGELWGMTGECQLFGSKGVMDYKLTASSGQCGSAIIGCGRGEKPFDVKDIHFCDDESYIIGVHTGFKHGTMITKEKYDWIKSIVNFDIRGTTICCLGENNWSK